jgi:LacI family transcriptional regulator
MRPEGAFVSKLPDDPFVQRLLDAGSHVIRIGIAPHRLDHLVPAVLPDMKAQGALAAEHFAERGFKHVGFVGHNPWQLYQSLYDRFQTRANELGCECHPFQWKEIPGVGQSEDVTSGIRYRERLKLFKSWLAEIPKPLGLLGFNDNRACLYGRMCMDAGFNVPNEIGILGIGNDEALCETVHPSISSIIVNDKAIAETAVSIFDSLLSGETLGITTLFVPPSGLVSRQSTDVFAAENRGVAKATRFMLDHFAEPITIAQITRASGMSRARLFVAFEKDLGHPPGAILTQVRIDKAKQLLRDTNEKVLTIAEACGFGASINMYHHFKAQLGMSPAQYRKDSTTIPS